MKRVLIIGCPGAGKSTLARRLRDKTGLPLYYLDMIWHKEDETTVSQEEFDTRIDEILEMDEWIIDGSYFRTFKKRIERCDTVILLDLPTEVCLRSVERRIGTKREDMPWIEKEFDPEFRQYIEKYKKTHALDFMNVLEKDAMQNSEKEIIILRSRDEVNIWIEEY